MKKILNKPISFLLAIILLFSSIGIAPTVLAAGATTEIKFGEAEGKIGDEVTIPVTISNNQGVSTFFFVVDYNAEDLTFVSAEIGNGFTGGTFTPVTNSTKGELSLAWFTIDGDVTQNGTLMNIKFKLNDTAKGDYPLTVRYLPQDIANSTYGQVECMVTNGKISTGSTVSGTVTSFGEATEPVTLRLLTNGTEIDKVTSTDGTYSFSSVSPGTYTIEVSKINHATRTYEITVEREDISEALKIHLLGDVTGDGKADTTDLAALKLFLAGIGAVEIGADLNEDGNIDTVDLANLKLKLSGV